MNVYRIQSAVFGPKTGILSIAATGLCMALASPLLFAGCGGASTGKKASAPTDSAPATVEPDLPPSPQVGIAPEVEKKPARKISRDARRDYADAFEHFEKQKARGWSRDTCESAADRFVQVASNHPKLVEAPFMAALSYHRCGMRKEAEQNYRRALKVDPSHARSLSNLGDLYFQSGKVKRAKKHWDSALQADSKIVAARNNLAWLLLQDLRKARSRSTWKRIEKQARDQLSASLAVNTENVSTYVLYALVYMEGWRRNRSRLDLAKLLLDEGAKRDDKFAPLYNTRGLLYMKRNRQGEALKNFRRAVELNRDFVEARMNVGNITLGFRKYDTAEEQFTKVIELQPKNYDAIIGLGIAQRGLGKLDLAEASYKKATQLSSGRGAAYFNLGVLYKDFRANSADDIKQSRDAYKQARSYFRTYMSKSDATKDMKKEAKDNISDCSKIIRQLDEVIEAMAKDAASGN